MKTNIFHVQGKVIYVKEWPPAVMVVVVVRLALKAYTFLRHYRGLILGNAIPADGFPQI